MAPYVNWERYGRHLLGVPLGSSAWTSPRASNAAPEPQPTT
jgi:hypothetical protein